METLATISFKYQNHLSEFRTDTVFFKGYKSLLKLRYKHVFPKLTQLPYKFEKALKYYTKVKVRENKWEQTHNISYNSSQGQFDS